jgi:hypothetical protein
MKTLQLSLADLTKNSAKRLCDIIESQKHYTPNTTRNFTTNDALTKYHNMRGTYSIKVNVALNNTIEEVQFDIHYVFDEIETNDLGTLLIEKKNVTYPVQTWYKQICIVQTAAYQAFAKGNSNKILQTASFAIDRDEPSLKLDLKNKFLRSELKFGKKEIYFIYVPEPETVIQYFIEKAIHALNFKTARIWDEKHNYKDLDFLHSSINCRGVYEKQRT